MVSSPLARTALREVASIVPPFRGPYSPAPLDETSLWNGVLKFDHGQACVSDEEKQWVLEELVEIFRPYAHGSQLTTPEDATQQLVSDTASGLPYCQYIGPKKQDVMKVMTGAQLWEDFVSYDQVINCTLKDELRAVGKDARLFRPVNVASIIAGICLFYDMNERLASSRRDTPYKIGIATPGMEMTAFWRQFFAFGGLRGCGDGSQWDARFPVWLVEVVCAFRKHFLPAEDPALGNVHDAVQRYYEQMYLGWSRVDGQLVRLIGNPSGHFNTASDNTLALIAVFRLIAKRLGVRWCDLLVSCYGDDSIWASKDPLFNAANIRTEGEKLGVFIETLGNVFTPDTDLVFIGTHPFVTQEGLVYSYDFQKLSASLWWRDKKGTDLDYVHKIISLSSLCRFHPSYWDLWAWVEDTVTTHWPQWVGELRFGRPGQVKALYLGFEDTQMGQEGAKAASC